jgi:hypothetical protein
MELVNTPLLNLEARVENRQRLTAMKKEIEKQLDAETDAIKNELAAMGLDELEVGNRLVTLQIRDRSTLDKTELISLGVTTDQIKRATKISTYLQLDVRDKK